MFVGNDFSKQKQVGTNKYHFMAGETKFHKTVTFKKV